MRSTVAESIRSSRRDSSMCASSIFIKFSPLKTFILDMMLQLDYTCKVYGY